MLIFSIDSSFCYAFTFPSYPVVSMLSVSLGGFLLPRNSLYNFDAKDFVYRASNIHNLIRRRHASSLPGHYFALWLQLVDFWFHFICAVRCLLMELIWLPCVNRWSFKSKIDDAHTPNHVWTETSEHVEPQHTSR